MPIQRFTRPRRALVALLTVALLAGCGTAATATMPPPTATDAPRATAVGAAVPSPSVTAAPSPTATGTTLPPTAIVVPSPTATPSAPATAVPVAPPSPTVTAPPAGPRTVATGQLVKVNEYNGRGQVDIVRGAGGALTARLTGFTVDDGPRLVVYLTREAGPARRAEVERGFVSLGPLKGFTGDFEYAIPAGTDLDAYGGLIIYCAEFHVTFLAAPLTR